MLKPVCDPSEGRARRCGPSACTVLTSDILHLSVAAMSAALSSSADNPLAQIWWRLLGSSNDKIPLMIVTSCLPARSEGDNGRKTWQHWLIPSQGLSFAACELGKKGTPKKMTKTSSCHSDSDSSGKYDHVISLHQNDLNVTFCQITLRKWIWSIQLHQSPWCKVHQGDWWNLSEACLVGECHMSPHALALINLWSKSPEWRMRLEGEAADDQNCLRSHVCRLHRDWPSAHLAPGPSLAHGMWVSRSRAFGAAKGNVWEQCRRRGKKTS